MKNQFIFSLGVLFLLLIALWHLPNSEAMPKDEGRDISLCLKASCVAGTPTTKDPLPSPPDSGVVDTGYPPDSGVYTGNDKTVDFDGTDDLCKVSGLPLDNATVIIVGMDETPTASSVLVGFWDSYKIETPYWLIQETTWSGSFPDISIARYFVQDSPFAESVGGDVGDGFAQQRTNIIAFELETTASTTSFSRSYGDYSYNYKYSGDSVERLPHLQETDSRWTNATIKPDGVIVGGYPGKNSTLRAQTVVVTDKLMTVSELNELMGEYGDAKDPRTVSWAGDIVAWWQPGTDNFNGTTWTDSSGNGYDMTCEGSMTESDGDQDMPDETERYQIRLNGTDEYMVGDFTTTAVKTLAIVHGVVSVGTDNTPLAIAEKDGHGVGNDKNYGVTGTAGSVAIIGRGTAYATSGTPSDQLSGTNLFYGPIAPTYADFQVTAIKVDPTLGDGHVYIAADYNVDGTVVDIGDFAVNSSHKMGTLKRVVVNRDGLQEMDVKVVIAASGFITNTQLSEIIDGSGNIADPSTYTWSADILSYWTPSIATYNAGTTWLPSGGTEPISLTLYNMGPENLRPYP